MAQVFPKLLTNKSQIQKAQKTPSTINTKTRNKNKNTLTYYI